MNELINYHRDRIDEISSPEERLEKIPFHLSVIEMLSRLDDDLARRDKYVERQL